jgi:hypothetical protein
VSAVRMLLDGQSRCLLTPIPLTCGLRIVVLDNTVSPISFHSFELKWSNSTMYRLWTTQFVGGTDCDHTIW